MMSQTMADETDWCRVRFNNQPTSNFRKVDTEEEVGKPL
jgi:hypothetical protein